MYSGLLVRIDLSVRIRSMTESDLDFAINLANQEHWDYDFKDVRRLQLLFPKGCFVAEWAGVEGGWIVACTYGCLMWISSLVVVNRLRGKGIGAALVDHAVKYARDLGARTVGLYSYDQSVGFYEKMGFKRDSVFEYVEGVGRETCTSSTAEQVEDLKEVIAFDHRYFPGDRTSLLKLLHKESPSLLFKSGETEISGYIAGTSFSDNFALIGPWVCEAKRVNVAQQLFVSELEQVKSNRIGLTIPSQNLDVHRIVEKYGFQVKRRVLPMFSGAAEDLPSVGSIYAAAGLDIG